MSKQQHQKKRVLVTGGASGIGAAVVNFFDEIGEIVCSADIKPPSMSTKVAGMHLQGDVSSKEDVARITSMAIDKMGGIDVLVNSAGIADTTAPTVDQDIEAWRKIIEINLTGTYLMCREVGMHMLQEGRGSVVNIASVAGISGFPRRNAYSSSKAAVINLTRSLACEWADRGVRVNCVAPGYIRTPLVDQLESTGKIDTGHINGRTLLGRLGYPSEIAHAVAYLSSEWSSYVTGAIIPVDGGWTAFDGSGEVTSF